jgi:N-acetylmuramoyl-L-alanine amidase
MNDPVFVIDPGHGGTNPGVRRGAFREADYNLGLAHDLYIMMAGIYCPTPIMIRDSNETLSLRDRGLRSFEAGSDCTFVLHVNAHADPSLRGFMCFHLDGDDLGKEVAEAIMHAAPEPLRRKRIVSTPAKSTDWTRRAYNCLSVHRSRCPILIEAFFVTNEKDRAFGTTTHGRRAIANAIISGADHYITKTQSPSSPGISSPNPPGSIRG